MRTQRFLVWGSALLILAGGARAQDATKQPTPEDIAKAQKLVQDQIGKLRAPSGLVTRLADASLQKAFPGELFFSVLYRQFPVGRLVPAPLKPSNIFVVNREGKAQLINDNKELEKFFRAHVDVVKQEERARTAAQAWLQLSSQLKQDGFYRFKLMEDSLKAAKEKGGLVAKGTMVVMQGGNGEINTQLTFNDEGKLAKVEENSKIRPGPRPICQATKLLDRDPIVRRMAEQDLLIMGKFAFPYLAEQRVKASPALRKAIDQMKERILDEDR
jgi:hypothetical protein